MRLTSFEIVFGRLPRLASSEPLREGDFVPTYNSYALNLVTHLSGIEKLAQDNLVASKHKSNKYSDRKINKRNFKVRKYVFLLSGPKPKKLGDHQTGAHKVLEVINITNVRIQINKSSKIVHAQRLRISDINHECRAPEKGSHKSYEEKDNEFVRVLLLTLV